MVHTYVVEISPSEHVEIQAKDIRDAAIKANIYEQERGKDDELLGRNVGRIEL